MKNILLLCAVLATCARADVKTYTSRAAWLAAVSNPTTIDFGKAAPVAAGSYRSYPTPPGLTLSGVNFSSTATGGIVSVTSQTFCCNTYKRGYDQLVSNYNGTGIAVTLPSGIAAFGFDLFSVVSGNESGTNQDSVDVTFAGQKYVIKTLSAPGTVFVGFVSTTPIATFTIVPEQLNGGTEGNIMNFSFSGGAPPSVTVVSATNQQSPTIAPASLVTILGTGLSFGSLGTAVAIVDSSGQQFDLPLLAVSPGQIEAVLPDGLATGLAVFTVTPGAGGHQVTASANIARVAPGILTANGTGQGLASALVTTTHTDGSATSASAYVCVGGTANCIALPIALSDQVVVTLYGTGIRGMSSLDAASVTVGGTSATVVSAGPQGDYSWLDQVSFQLPGTLAGAGVVNVLLAIDGVAANTVTLRVN